MGSKRVVYLPVEGDRILRVELDVGPDGKPASAMVAVYKQEVGAVLDEHDIQTVREGLGIDEP